MARGALRRDEAGAAGVDRDTPELANGGRGEFLDAVGPRGKRVGQFPGHGAHVLIGGPHARLRLRECARERIEPEPERRGDLHGVDDPPVLRARRLEVRPADVPSDDNSHVRSRHSRATLPDWSHNSQVGRIIPQAA